MLRIPTGGRLTSWLFTLWGQGFEQGTTMLQIQLVVREADLNPGPPDYKSAPLTTRPHCLHIDFFFSFLTKCPYLRRSDADKEETKYFSKATSFSQTKLSLTTTSTSLEAGSVVLFLILYFIKCCKKFYKQKIWLTNFGHFLQIFLKHWHTQKRALDRVICQFTS